MRRFAAHVLTALVLALTALTVASGAAAAADFPTGTDCLQPPDPASPSSGVSAWIDSGPANPANGDPFAPGSKVSIYDVYGYAGTTIVRFDPGCGPSFDLWGDMANFNQGVSSVTIATATKLYRTVLNPAFGAIFDGIQEKAQKVLGNGLFLPLVGISMGLTGLYFVLRSGEGDVKEAAHGSFKSLGILTIGIVCTLYPLTLGAAIDQKLGEVISVTSSLAANSGSKEPADALAASAITSINYNTWKQATFGTGALNEKVANEYAPRLFKAKAFTRAEQAIIDKDPSKAEAMADAKREQYKEAALEIQDKYPTVYEWVAGNQTASQFGFSIAGVIGGLISLAFLIYALFRIGYAIVIVRIGIGGGPLVALLSVFPKLHHLMTSVLTVLVKAVVAGAYFGAGAVLFTVVAVGTILSPSSTLHPVVKIFAMLVLTYAMLRGAKELGIQLRQQKPAPNRRYADFHDPTMNVDPLTPASGGANTSRPRDIGFVTATPRQPHATATAPSALAGSAARTTGTAALGGAKGAAKGARAGMARATVYTAASMGTGAGVALGTVAKSTAIGAAAGAAKATAGKAATNTASAVAHRTTRPQLPAAAKSGTVVYHPDQTAPRPGPSGRPQHGRPNATGDRVYNIYKPKAGAK